MGMPDEAAAFGSRILALLPNSSGKQSTKYIIYLAPPTLDAIASTQSLSGAVGNKTNFNGWDRCLPEKTVDVVLGGGGRASRSVNNVHRLCRERHA